MNARTHLVAAVLVTAAIGLPSATSLLSVATHDSPQIAPPAMLAKGVTLKPPTHTPPPKPPPYGGPRPHAG